MKRNIKLAVALSFFIYLLPVPNIALNGHFWGTALWWLVRFELGAPEAIGSHATLALLMLTAAVQTLSFVLWFGFLWTPGAWKLLFAPVGFAIATVGTIQLHQCTEQVWWPGWALGAPEEQETKDAEHLCSVGNAYLIASAEPNEKTVEVFLINEGRSATVRSADCRIVGGGKAEASEPTGGESVSWDGFMWDAYPCAVAHPIRNWRGVTYSGQSFPTYTTTSMHGYGGIWEEANVRVWVSRPGVPGRYWIEVGWSLGGDEQVSVPLPPERSLSWWTFSSDQRYIALSVTNRLHSDSVRDFVVVYETETGREVFRRYGPPLSYTEVQFAGPRRLVFTEVRDAVPEVAVYQLHHRQGSP